MHLNDVLTNNNYKDWAQEIKNICFAKNKIGFMGGTIDKLDAKLETYI